MFIAFLAVTTVAAALVFFSAWGIFSRAEWVVEPLTHYGVPRSWWPWLGTAKAAGAAGLLIGLFVPVVGVMAGAGLVLYFVGAEITVIRAGWYSNMPFPLIYLTSAAAALALRLAV